MSKILIVADYYLPGYKGGGPIRTIANLVDWLGDEFDFYILTRDRDLGDETAYPDVQVNTWMRVGKAHVYYATPDRLTLSGLKGLLHNLTFDALYVNSFFSILSVKIAYLYWLKQIHQKTWLIAPRGEFHRGALNIKPFKKQIYLFMTRFLHWYADVHWVASNEEEATMIKGIFPHHRNMHVTPDLVIETLSNAPRMAVKDESIRIIFFSRIAPKKNLDGALLILCELQNAIQFDIYGPLEDLAYWQTCQNIMATLPSHIVVSYKGVLHPGQVVETLSTYHLLLFPTHGENFGYVIWEALYAGVPVLLSDQTPWHDVETLGIGWEVPLDDHAGFVRIIEKMIDMNDTDFYNLSARAHDYAVQVAHNSDALQANRALFLNLL